MHLAQPDQRQRLHPDLEEVLPKPCSPVIRRVCRKRRNSNSWHILGTYSLIRCPRLQVGVSGAELHCHTVTVTCDGRPNHQHLPRVPEACPSLPALPSPLQRPRCPTGGHRSSETGQPSSQRTTILRVQRALGQLRECLPHVPRGRCEWQCESSDSSLPRPVSHQLLHITPFEDLVEGVGPVTLGD